MESFLHFLQHTFPLLFSHTYIFLFIGASIEGLSTLVIGGFLVSTHSIKFWPAIIAFAFGHTINGFIWYSVGYFTGAKSLDRWGRSKEKSRKVIEKVEQYFHRHSGKAIFITKFTLSLTIATQVMAGSFKYDIRKYAWYNFIGSVCWATFAMSIGYFFGAGYGLLFRYMKDFAGFIIFLGCAIALIYILKWIFKSVFIRSISVHDHIKNFSNKIRGGLDKFLSDGDDGNQT